MISSNSNLIEVYHRLNRMKENEEIKVLKEEIREKMYQNMRLYFLELLSLGKVIGFDELEQEMQKAIQLIGQLKTN